MPSTLDPAILSTLRTAKEVRIRTSKHKGRGVIIWVVVVGDTPFVRSVRGPKGQWWEDAAAEGRATLAVGDQQVPVRTLKVTDAATIDAVSQEYLRKYAGSPYAKSIVAPDTLPTTLQLTPL